MKLDKYQPLTVFEIWQPRWHDKRVLLNASKVDRAKTKYLKIKFTKAPSMAGSWVIDRTRVKQFKKETNGTIQCYSVPLKELLTLEISERSDHEWK